MARAAEESPASANCASSHFRSVSELEKPRPPPGGASKKHPSTYNDEPKDVKTMFIQRIRRSVGLTAHLGWARLLLDRLKDLVQIPGASTHTSGWDAEPDDEEEHERDNYLNPEFIQRHAH